MDKSIHESEVLLAEINGTCDEHATMLGSLRQELTLEHEQLQQLKLSIASLSSQLSASKQRTAEHKVNVERLDTELKQLRVDIEQDELKESDLVAKLAQDEARYTVACASLVEFETKQQVYLTQVNGLKSHRNDIKAKQAASNNDIQTLKTKLALKEQATVQQKSG